jgi:hypothetical protein
MCEVVLEGIWRSCLYPGTNRGSIYTSYLYLPTRRGCAWAVAVGQRAGGLAGVGAFSRGHGDGLGAWLEGGGGGGGGKKKKKKKKKKNTRRKV